MEFLKELFGDGSLTYDQLSQAAKDKGFQVVNAAGGAYVPKADLDNLSGQVATLTGQLGEANKKLEGYDPTWRDKAQAAQQDLEQKQLNFALEKGVTAAKAKNAKAVIALLDRSKLSFNGGEVLGLNEQLDSLKTEDSTAFLFEQEPPASTGMSHQNAREVGGGDKKTAANNAFRTLFGRNN